NRQNHRNEMVESAWLDLYRCNRDRWQDCQLGAGNRWRQRVVSPRLAERGPSGRDHRSRRGLAGKEWHANGECLNDYFHERKTFVCRFVEQRSSTAVGEGALI